MKSLRTLTIVLLIAAFTAALPALASDFPSENIRWIVTYAPGGGFDLMSRAIARSMKKYLPPDVHVVIKNISGGGGRTGAVSLYRSKPDGYTVGILDIGGLIGPQLVDPSNLNYDMDKFTYLARVANEPYTVFVSAKSRYEALEDLKQAERLTWVSSTSCPRSRSKSTSPGPPARLSPRWSTPMSSRNSLKRWNCGCGQ